MGFAQYAASRSAWNPQPRLIHVSIKPAGEVPFTIGGTKQKAIDYVLHVKGGIAGAVAPPIGKQLGHYHIWILLRRLPPKLRSSILRGRVYIEGTSKGRSGRVGVS